MIEFDPVPRRVFLGLGHPPLLAAARWLRETSPPDPELLVVTPGARAGRVLLAMLASEAQSVITPPILLTPGALREALLPPIRPKAGGIARTVAWMEAVDAFSDIELEPLTGRSEASRRVRNSMARLLSSASEDLAGEAMRFADLLPRLRILPSFPDLDRWELAARIQDRYESTLGHVGLVDGALHAIDRLNSADLAGRHVLLVGTATLRPVIRRALAGSRVTSLIAAPQEAASGFDELGCIDVDFWMSAPIPIDTSRIRFVGSPREQAEAAITSAAVLDDRSACDVSIGLADPSITDALERSASRAGLRVHPAAGRSFGSTRLGKLLQLLIAHLNRPGFDSLSALARHPDVEAALVGDGRPHELEWWVTALDVVAQRHLATSLEPVWGDGTDEPSSSGRAVNRLMRSIEELLHGLLGEDGRDSAPVQRWAQPIGSFLTRVYGHRLLAPGNEDDRLLLGAAQAVGDALADLARHGPARSVSSAEALELLVESLQSVSVPVPTPPEAIEALGWLELTLDSAPDLVVVGLNEGRIPRIGQSDALLTPSVRSTLGLQDDRLIEARDAYVLWSITQGYRRVTLIAGRTDAQGAPTLPSRLLFREEKELTRRARLYLDPSRSREKLRSAHLHGQTSDFPIARVHECPAITTMSVTSFADYLRSPYLFYLRHVRGLLPFEPPEGQLDPPARGSLVHELLEALGRRGPWAGGHPGEIEEFLHDELSSLALRRFGQTPPPAVVVQLLGLHRELSRFAAWQSARTALGWRIIEVEWRPERGAASLDVEGSRQWLTGTIDRIERHETRGTYAILDFKTGTRPTNPDNVHRRAGRWVSLQLPLYRHLAAPLGIGEEPLLAFVCAGSADEQIDTVDAEWTPRELAAADEAARAVVRGVREHQFSEIGDLSAAPDVFRWLAGDGFLSSRGGAT
ncbi:MAG: PD-(D/E)XK nuclease family protein [Phycisphaeraceae bacterium]|nr:PD-(D/E)XK nuclease family protein [Phycisphaeraceae bacterium]